MRRLCIGFLVMLWGCGDGHHEDIRAVQQDAWASYLEARQQSDNPAECTRLVYADVQYQDATRRLDSLFQVGPRIRYYSDSLAHVDSMAFASIVRLTLSRIYNHQDTTLAVLTYIEYLPWLEVLEPSSQIHEALMQASDSGEAMALTQSPYMARLSYQIFERTKQMALAHGDPKLYDQAEKA